MEYTTATPIIVTGDVYCAYCSTKLSRNDTAGYYVSKCGCRKALERSRAAGFETGFRTALWRYRFSSDEIEKAYQEEIKPKEIRRILPEEDK